MPLASNYDRCDKNSSALLPEAQTLAWPESVKVHMGSGPTTTHLVRVSHHEQLAAGSRDLPDQLKLTQVGVLALINQHMSPALVQFLTNLRDRCMRHMYTLDVVAWRESSHV